MPNTISNTGEILNYVLKNSPVATAIITGSPLYPEIKGTYSLYPTMSGLISAIEVFDLPYSYNNCENQIFALNIYDTGSCQMSGNIQGLTEYNPNGCIAPFKAGNLMPLYPNRGYAWYVTIDARFSAQEVIGKAIIISAITPNTSQIAPGTQNMLACGIIRPYIA